MSDIANNQTIHTDYILGDMIFYADYCTLDEKQQKTQDKNLSFRNSYLYSLLMSNILQIEAMYEKLYDLYQDLYNENGCLPSGKVTSIKDFFEVLKDSAPNLVYSENRVILFKDFMINHISGIIDEAMCDMVKNYDNNWFLLKEYKNGFRRKQS